MQNRKDNIHNRTLSIRISTDGFCFCSYVPADASSLRFFFHKPDSTLTLAANMQKALELCPFVEEGARYDIKAIVETEEFTTLPAEYDNKEEYKTFYAHCFPRCDARVEIVANRLNAQGLTVLFPVEKSLYNMLQTVGNVTYYTPLSILLGFVAKLQPNEERYMLAYFQGSLAMFISMNGGRMQLANIFRSNEGENSLYYLLSIWKEQGLSQTDDTLYICGDKSADGLMLMIKRFVKNCNRMNANDLFASNLLNNMNGVPFDLQAMMLCE